MGTTDHLMLLRLFMTPFERFFTNALSTNAMDQQTNGQMDQQTDITGGPKKLALGPKQLETRGFLHRVYFFIVNLN